jgi:hypothetical protein
LAVILLLEAMNAATEGTSEGDTLEEALVEALEAVLGCWESRRAVTSCRRTASD